ncbi:MAG TPA: MerR family transcriptional regulator [Acidimicrobiia bacterium]|nr:MerR family transcriptional regulator [Acidimicrobiia bacterium]
MSEKRWWRIDDLARATGVTARNLRAYQSQGLLAAPRLVGRVGRYDAGHLDRVRAIQRLHARGFSLTGIKVLFDAHDRGQTLADLLGVAASAGEPRTGGRVSHLPRLALLPGPWAEHLTATAPTAN